MRFVKPFLFAAAAMVATPSYAAIVLINSATLDNGQTLVTFLPGASGQGVVQFDPITKTFTTQFTFLFFQVNSESSFEVVEFTRTVPAFVLRQHVNLPSMHGDNVFSTFASLASRKGATTLAFAGLNDQAIQNSSSLTPEGGQIFGNDISLIGNDSFNGTTFLISPVTPPVTLSVAGTVPEPSTWAMMLLGFGFVGGAMRSSRRRQKVTISYA